MSRKLFLLLINVFISFQIFAQGPSSGSWSASSMPSGGIAGSVINAEDNSPIEYGNVIVKDSAGNLVNGVITDETGNFNVQKIPFEKKVSIEFSFIGFQTILIEDIVLSVAQPFYQTGQIIMKPDAELLQAVEITGQKVVVQTSLDKKTYNVDKSTITKSKSASDVLAELPSVSVEADGTISLRGNSNVRILIDGESSLTQSGNIELILQQIPAESIEKIDLVTNPSAKYDPDGTAGIINIILKKEKQRGINGTVSAGIGTWDKYNLATFINYRKNKFGLTANYNFRYTDSYSINNSERASFSEEFSNVLTQEGISKNDNMSHFGRIGFTYNPNKKHALSFGALSNYFQFNRDEDLVSTTDYTNSEFTEVRNTNSLFNGRGKFTNANVYHTILFKEAAANVKFGLNYSFFTGDFDGGNTTDTLSNDELYFLSAQKTFVNAASHTIDIPVDFVIPINDNITTEFGLKTNVIFRNSDFSSTRKLDAEADFTNDELLNYDYSYQEQIHAIYGNHIHSIKRFSYQLGLRLEEVLIRADVVPEVGEVSKFKRNYFGWFPSVFVRQGLGKDEKSLHEIQFSYSRRINRPDFRRVNPNRDFSDPLNQRQGNPFLQPEFITSLELGYNKVWNKVTLNSSLFYKLTNDEISGVTLLIDSITTLTTFDNIGKSHEYGWEFVSKFQMFKWWNIGADFNIAQRIIKGEGDFEFISSERLSYGGKITSTMNVWKGLEIQLIGRYQGPNATAQGQRDGFGTLDVALKQDILKNKGSISFTANDIFNTQVRAGFSSTENFDEVYRDKRETRIFWLTFSYGFGKMGEMFNKRNSRRSGGEDDGGDDGLF
jgi:outer membrane receptor protein involved in Fe transport